MKMRSYLRSARLVLQEVVRTDAHRGRPGEDTGRRGPSARPGEASQEASPGASKLLHKPPGLQHFAMAALANEHSRSSGSCLAVSPGPCSTHSAKLSFPFLWLQLGPKSCPRLPTKLQLAHPHAYEISRMYLNITSMQNSLFSFLSLYFCFPFSGNRMDSHSGQKPQNHFHGHLETTALLHTLIVLTYLHLDLAVSLPPPFLHAATKTIFLKYIFY